MRISHRAEAQCYFCKYLVQGRSPVLFLIRLTISLYRLRTGRKPGVVFVHNNILMKKIVSNACQTWPMENFGLSFVGFVSKDSLFLCDKALFIRKLANTIKL